MSPRPCSEPAPGRTNSCPFSVASVNPSSSSSCKSCRNEHRSQSWVALEPSSGTSSTTGAKSVSMRKAVSLAKSPARKVKHPAVNGLLYVVPQAEETKLMWKVLFSTVAANLWRQISRLPCTKILAMQDSSRNHHIDKAALLLQKTPGKSHLVDILRFALLPATFLWAVGRSGSALCFGLGGPTSLAQLRLGKVRHRWLLGRMVVPPGPFKNIWDYKEWFK